MTQDTVLHDKRVMFHDEPMDDKLGFVHQQYIPKAFLDSLRDERENSLHTPSGNFHRVAAIPVVVADELKAKYNFDVTQESIPTVIKMLKRCGLDWCLTTNKSI